MITTIECEKKNFALDMVFSFFKLKINEKIARLLNYLEALKKTRLISNPVISKLSITVPRNRLDIKEKVTKKEGKVEI